MNEAQKKIKDLVDGYKEMFYDEYIAVCNILKKKRANRTDSFADLSKDTDTIDRQLNEYPETLHTILYANLSPEEFTYFNSKEGARWFTSKYKEFRTPEKL